MGGIAFTVSAFRWDEQPAIVRDIGEPGHLWLKAFIMLAVATVLFSCSALQFMRLPRLRNRQPRWRRM